MMLATILGYLSGLQLVASHLDPATLTGTALLVLVCDGDIGGLLGLHFRDDMGLAIPVVSIDGIDLREFDFIDIGTIIPSSGAVPVVIKSLVFPAAAGARLDDARKSPLSA